MSQENTRVLLSSRPQGWVTQENFDITQSSTPNVEQGQMLVRNLWLSLDPYMRGRMNDAESYVPPFQVGEVLQGQAVAEVVASKHEKFSEGDLVTGMFGWEEYSLSGGEGVRKVERSGVPLRFIHLQPHVRRMMRRL